VGFDAVQHDEIGGANPTTSKFAVVGHPQRRGMYPDYKVAQAALRSVEIDFMCKCGIVAASVRRFAVDEGIVKLLPGGSMILN
jgi:2-methylaconitate cis-trans-isomerase PrpF